MLVLTRKKEEKLYLGTEITVTVLKVKGNTVQLGIEAPRSVKILRGELAAQEPNKVTKPATRPSEAARKMLGSNRLRELTARVKNSPAREASLMQLV